MDAYADLRSKFSLVADEKVATHFKEYKSLACAIVCAHDIIHALHTLSALSADEVRLMQDMKKVQTKLRKLKVLPTDLPEVVKEKYLAGLTMD